MSWVLRKNRSAYRAHFAQLDTLLARVRQNASFVPQVSILYTAAIASSVRKDIIARWRLNNSAKRVPVVGQLLPWGLHRAKFVQQENIRITMNAPSARGVSIAATMTRRPVYIVRVVRIQHRNRTQARHHQANVTSRSYFLIGLLALCLLLSRQ